MVWMVRRSSWPRPSRRNPWRAMMTMLSSVVLRGCWPVWTAYCSAGSPNVVPQAVQDVLAEHAVEAREDVGGDVAERVPDVQAGTARVGEHVEDEQMPAGVRGDPLGVCPGAGRVRGVVGASLLPAVLPGHLDLPGQRLGGVAVRGLAHLVLVRRVVVRGCSVVRLAKTPRSGGRRAAGWPSRLGKQEHRGHAGVRVSQQVGQASRPATIRPARQW